MIDHLSIAVSDLARSAAFYDAVLGALGYRRLVERPWPVAAPTPASPSRARRP